jgi:protein TonB
MTANERMKGRWDARFWGSLALAVVLHAALFQLWPTMAVALPVDPEPPISDVGPIDEVPPPEEPEEIPTPATPIVGDVEPGEVVEFAPTTWDAYPREGPPPPAEKATTEGSPPFFFKADVPPRLTNAREVERLLQSEYPPLLRDAGISGTATVLFHIDEAGSVIETRLGTGSGHEAFDRAAMAIADRMRFSPAMNRDLRVAVWVAIPVTFSVR